MSRPRATGVLELASLMVLGCGFDARGLGGGLEPPLAENTVTTGFSGSSTSSAIASFGGEETGGAATSMGGSDDGRTHDSSGDDTTGSEVTTAPDADLSTQTSDAVASDGGGTDAGSSDGSGGDGSSTGSASTGDPTCDDDLEGLVFAADARLVEYELRTSELLDDFRGEPVPYARADTRARERYVAFPVELACAGSVYAWALVYTGAAVEPVFDVDVVEGGVGEAVRWQYACGGRETDWTWVPVARSIDACLDGPVAFELEAGVAEIRFTPPEGVVSVLAGLAFATDPGFSPDSLYTP